MVNPASAALLPVYPMQIKKVKAGFPLPLVMPWMLFLLPILPFPVPLFVILTLIICVDFLNITLGLMEVNHD